MSFSYTTIFVQAIDTLSSILVRGYNTGTGVECNICIRTDVTVDGNAVTGESSQSNFFVPNATVSSLAYDLSVGSGFEELYSFNSDNTGKTRRVLRAAEVTEGVIVCPYYMTRTGNPLYVFEKDNYFLPGASISGTDIIGGGAGGSTDANAIHKNVASEIHGITLKSTPVSADEVVIEDSAALWVKKRVTVGSLGGGGGGQTNTVAGATGITNTGNNVDAVLAPTYGSSANTICQGNDSRLSDSRTPTSHASSHDSGGADALAIDAVAGTGSLRTLGTAATAACAGNDSRLSDARTPTTHASSHNAGGGDALAIDAVAGTGSLRTLGTTSTSACAGNDSRLSDSRTPTSHASSHNSGGVDALAIDAVAGTGSLRTLGTSATAACSGNDSRLSDSRTPTSHAATHKSGGADSIKLDELAAPTDNTTLDADATKHGLLPKLGGGTTNFLRADGTWAAPPSGGGGYQLIPITTNENTDQSSDIVVGALGITGASFGAATVKFVATAFVADSGLTGTVTLYNLTDASAEAALSFTELVSTHKASSGLTLDSGAKMYEVRIKVTGGSVSSDVISCMWAGIELS